MTDEPIDPAELVRQVEALTRDRDYWRAQHDAVMADWKADVDDWATVQAERLAGAEPAAEPLMPEPAALRESLADLLRFFDPVTGAVTTRVGEQTLSEAFLRASGPSPR